MQTGSVFDWGAGAIMADQSWKVLSCGGLAFAVWMATSFVQAQEPPTTATVEVVPGGDHPLIAPPKALSELQLHIAIDDPGAITDLTKLKQPSVTVFPTTPYVANAGGYHADCPYGRYYILCHDPLYTEDIPLERYGCALPCGYQAAWSAGKFFASIPVLPLKWAGNCWNKNGWCRDYMGQLRPGCHECGCGKKPWYCDDNCCPQGGCTTSGACQIGCATN